MVMTASTAFTDILDQAATFAPNLFYAVVLLIIGYIAGRIVYAIIDRVLDHTHVDRYFAEEGHLELELSNLFAELAKWIVYFVFLQQAAILLQVDALTMFLEQLVNYVPKVIGAIGVFLAGYGIGVYTKDQIVGSETLYADLLGKMIFFFVLYVGFATALDIAEIPAGLLNNILLIVVASMGLAFAIAAGWGLKDVFQEEAQRYIDERM